MVEITTLASKFSEYFMSCKYTCSWYNTHTPTIVLIFKKITLLQTWYLEGKFNTKNK